MNAKSVVHKIIVLAIYAACFMALISPLIAVFIVDRLPEIDIEKLAAERAQEEVDRPSLKPTSSHSQNLALFAARDFVKERLKAPRTAKWPGWFDTDERVTHLGGGTYAILSYVDAENSFGAMLRMHYVCKVRYVGIGEWRLEELNIYQ